MINLNKSIFVDNYNEFRKWELISESQVPKTLLKTRLEKMIRADDWEIPSVWKSTGIEGGYEYTYRPFPGTIIDDIEEGISGADSKSHWFQRKVE